MGAGKTAYFKGAGGAVFEMRLPLTEPYAEQVTKGTLRRVNPDGSPYAAREAEAVDADAPTAVTERPANSATKTLWVGWAVTCGADPEEAEGMTKADLIDRYGEASPAPPAAPTGQ
jgi:hypothetical protein